MAHDLYTVPLDERRFTDEIIPIMADTLDKIRPGWYNRIDTSILNTMESELCIAGQQGENWLELAIEVACAGPMTQHESELGFANDPVTWIAEITSRRMKEWL